MTLLQKINDWRMFLSRENRKGWWESNKNDHGCLFWRVSASGKLLHSIRGHQEFSTRVWDAELEIVVCLFRQICGNSACSHKACRNSLWEQRLFPQSLSEQLFPQICRNRLLGVPIENKCVKGGGLLYGGLTTVPTNIVLTPNVAFLLAVPTNLSEQTTIYNSALRGEVLYTTSVAPGSWLVRILCLTNHEPGSTQLV